MSDEAQIETAFFHADETRGLPWHGLSPDEEAMAHEEGRTEERGRDGWWAVPALMGYLLAGGGRSPKAVAARALAVLRWVEPSALVGREIPPEQVGSRAALARELADLQGEVRYNFEELRRVVDAERETVRGILGFFLQPGPNWLRVSLYRIYIVALFCQPQLLAARSFEDLARTFGELDGSHREEVARARSRWSARAKHLLRELLEAGGGSVPDLFGKSATVRAKYHQAAKGNSNRKRNANCPSVGANK